MELLERILKQNPWWQNKEINEIGTYKERFILKDIEKYFDAPQIIAILGLRRTGKSVLLFQIIKKLLQHTPPKRILYFSFDEILGKEPDIAEEIVELYENEILKNELEDVYIFFDEITHLQNWQIILKRFYDLKKRIKFFISGSSGVYLKKSKESLAGRIYEFNIYPLTFREYLYLKDIKVNDLSLQRISLKKELNKYFFSGSMPEIIGEQDFLKVKKYVNSVVDKIIFYDIPKVYEVNEPEVLKMIFSLIAERPGMILEYQSLASALKVTYQTVSKYADYLEKAFLIKIIYNFRGSPVARARKLKKAYLGSINFISAFLDSEEDLLGKIPFLAENLICLSLDIKWFWRKYTEIDFYYKGLPIEIKYSQTRPDIKNSLLAAKYLKAKKLLVLTKDIEKEEQVSGIKTSYVPLWKFLLMDEKSASAGMTGETWTK